MVRVQNTSNGKTITVTCEESCYSGLVKKVQSKLQRRYNVSMFHVVCTVTVRIVCSRCDASLVIGHFRIYISKPFVICARSTSYFSREKENKNL